MDELNRVREAITRILPVADLGVDAEYRLVVFERTHGTNRPTIERWELTIHASGKGEVPSMVKEVMK